MLNAGDIEFMKESQDEIYTLRSRPITFIYLEKEYDPITGMLIGESEAERVAEAVITEMSIAKANGSRFYDDGIEYEKGDIKIDVKISLVEDIIVDIKQAQFDDKDYEILGDDKKGIGERNRYELLGRVLT